MSDSTTPFAERFLAFYDSCSPDERDVLDAMGSAAVVVSRGGFDEEVQGFEANQGAQAKSLQDAMRQLKLMNEILSNVSKTRGEISMTFARNARA